jgi:hypothetical protein
MSQQQATSRSFDSIMKESVTQGLKYSLGEGGVMVLARNFDLEHASLEPEKLHSMLSSLFNDLGGLVLEREILRQLYDNIGERYVEVPGQAFGPYVATARQTYEAQSRRLH